MQASTVLLAMVATAFLEHHAWRVPLAIVEQHALPAPWVMFSMLEPALNALQPHASDAISPLQPSALSAAAPPISKPALICVWPALVHAAAAKLQKSAQTVSMATSCKPSTT